MPIDYFRLKERRFPEVRQSYREKDTMFYALALGAGQQPTHSRMLRWVYEKELEALPTMAVVLAHPGFWLKEPDSGVDWRHVLHGEQRLRVHAPLATSGEVIGTTCVKALIDKGEGKGAVVVTERTLRDAGSGGLLASIEQMTFCRADGGFAQGGRQPSDAPLSALVRCPPGSPTSSHTFITRPDSALLYRLCADLNPLHADPEIARQAGFEQPILHGLATYGIAGMALLASVGDFKASRLRRLDARFTAPVFPGDTLRTDIWQCEGGVLSFRVTATERNVMVLDCGMAELDVA